MAETGLGNEMNPNKTPSMEQSVGFDSFNTRENTIGRAFAGMAREIVDPGQNSSLLTDMLGTNPLAADAAKVDVASVSVDQTSAKQTQANAQAAVGAKQDLSAHIENTIGQIEKVQTQIRGQLDQAFDNLADADGNVHDGMGNTYNREQLRGAFDPASSSTNEGDLLVGAKTGGGKFTQMADIAASGNMNGGNVSTQMKNLIAEEMAKIQYHDPETPPGVKGRIAEAWQADQEAKANGTYDPNKQSAMLKLQEKMLQPAENFPEVAEMRATENELAQVIEQHHEIAPEVAEAVKAEEKGIHTQDIGYTAELGQDVADIEASAALAGDSLSGISGARCAVPLEIAGIVAKLADNAAAPVLEVKEPQAAFAPV